MPTVEVKNLQNQVVGELSLSDEVFGAPLNEALIYDALKNYQANQRQGNHAIRTDYCGAREVLIAPDHHLHYIFRAE